MMGFGDAVASAEPYANNLHLVPDRQLHQHIITVFTGRMLFLMPNQQCQSTERQTKLNLSVNLREERSIFKSLFLPQKVTI